MNENSKMENKAVHQHIVKSNNYSISLLDVFIELWKGRLIVFLSVASFLLLAVCYLFSVKQQWSSQAIIRQPDFGIVTEYNTIMNVLYEEYPQDKPSLSDLQKNIFSRFTASIYTIFDTLQYDKPLAISVSKPAMPDDPVTIKVISDNDREAQEKLSWIIKSANDDIVNSYREDVKAILAAKVNELSYSLKAQEQVLEERKHQHLQVLNHALIIAKEAGVNTSPLTQAEYLSNDTLYLLGEKALIAMIANEQTNPLVYDEAYYETKRNLAKVENLNVQLNKFEAFTWVSRPDASAAYESPVRVVVLFLGGLLGILFGIVVVLVRNLLARYRQRYE